jgi:tetratricopeptide (TPR) repeat protein
MRYFSFVMIMLTAIPAVISAPAAANDRSTCDRSSGEPAIAACTRLIGSRGITPKNLALTYSNRGLEYFQSGRYDQAIADYNQAIALQRSALILSNRALAYARTDRFDLALLDYAEAIKLDPARPLSYSNRAVVWYRKGDLGKALADLDMAAQLSPKDARILSSRGNVRQQKGDIDGAMADFERVVKLLPNYPDGYENRANIWRIRGDNDRAIGELNRSIELNPRLPSAYAYRGLVYEAKGDFDRARADYRIAVALPPLSRDGNWGTDHSGIQKTARTRLAILEDTNDGPPPTRPSAPAQPASTQQPPPKASSGTAGPFIGRRIALVIGNGAYLGAPGLPNPANDAQLIAKNLREIGFEVTAGNDLRHADMKRTILDFLRGAATSKMAVVFYAGHGMQVDGRNYLVPIDTIFSKGVDIAADLIDVDFILTGLDDKIRTNIIVLDACRDNPLAQKAAQVASTSRSITVRSGLATPSGLGAGATLGAGTLLAFATAPGQVALDGDGANSPFSAALGRHISTPGLEVQQMLTRVRSEVVSATRNKQVPWSNSSLLGEVYLVGGKP